VMFVEGGALSDTSCLDSDHCPLNRRSVECIDTPCPQPCMHQLPGHGVRQRDELFAVKFVLGWLEVQHVCDLLVDLVIEFAHFLQDDGELRPLSITKSTKQTMPDVVTQVF